MTAVSVIICAFGPQPYLADAVDAVLRSRDVDAEVIVVDNGSPDCADLPDEVTVLRPGTNTGFAGGCNLGAGQAAGQTLAFVNSDAIVDPQCLVRLHAGAVRPGAGLVGATIVLADDPGEVNSWGNPVNLLGFSWAGGYGHPVSEVVSGERASVSGAVFAVRREVFAALQGMDAQFFAYGEDVDLSLRTWLRGATVEVLAQARAAHHYEFARNPDKWYLLERNRLVTVLTTYEGRTLLGLAPLLAAGEAAVLLRSVREGWARQKVRGWGWLLTHRRYLRSRRNRVQGSRVCGDEVLMRHLTTDLQPPARFGISVPPGVQRLVTGYWRRIGSRVAGV